MSNKHPNLTKYKSSNPLLYDEDYCSLCAGLMSKMWNHKFAHKLIVRGELLLAQDYKRYRNTPKHLRNWKEDT